MPDCLTPEQRYKCMSSVHSRNTKPEVKLRKELFRLGFRFRLNVKNLPGKPDIVLAKYRTCIFVNGCFWHGHQGCPKFTRPKTNAEFWRRKVDNNRERDLRDYAFLESFGWRVIVIWECELKKDRREETLLALAEQISRNGTAYTSEQSQRRERNAEHRARIKAAKERYESIMKELGLLR